MYKAYKAKKANNPTVDQYYMMQIAQHVARKFADKPEEIKLEQFKIPFTQSEEKKPLDKKTAVAIQKARVMAAMGLFDKPKNESKKK